MFSSEYETWFVSLPENEKAAISVDLQVLRHFGPALGRPHVDHVKGSRFSNMKELRTKISGHVYRSLFAFDPKRQAVLLIGDDKKGKNQQKFYQQLIAHADAIFEEYLSNLKDHGKGVL